MTNQQDFNMSEKTRQKQNQAPSLNLSASTHIHNEYIIFKCYQKFYLPYVFEFNMKFNCIYFDARLLENLSRKHLSFYHKQYTVQ